MITSISPKEDSFPVSQKIYFTDRKLITIQFKLISIFIFIFA